MIRVFCLLLLLTGPLRAETVVAARTIPANTTLVASDVVIDDRVVPGGISDAAQIIGMEARVALFAGRPIRMGDVGRPAVVERNQIIILHYQHHGLAISTEGRALDRAGPGDIIRVMNIASRSTVSAKIGQDGSAYVQR